MTSEFALPALSIRGLRHFFKNLHRPLYAAVIIPQKHGLQ